METLETMAKQSPACAAGLCNTLVPHVCQMISSAETLPEGAIESAIDLVTVLIQTGAGNFASIPNLVDIFALVTRLGGADGVELCSRKGLINKCTLIRHGGGETDVRCKGFGDDDSQANQDTRQAC